jgi:hypothetical protein
MQTIIVLKFKVYNLSLIIVAKLLRFLRVVCTPYRVGLSRSRFEEHAEAKRFWLAFCDDAVMKSVAKIPTIQNNNKVVELVAKIAA